MGALVQCCTASTICLLTLEFPVFVMDPVLCLSSEEFSDGINPRNAINALGFGKRRKSVSSAIRIMAMSVPTPLKDLNFLTLGAYISDLAISSI